MEKIIIKTKKLLIKLLNPEDVTEDYLWRFKDQMVKKFITSSEYKDIDSLKKYVSEQSSKKNVIFLEIFTLKGLHIGNIKFEKIDKKNSSTTLGILIGNKNWRGKGTAVEILNVCINWLFNIYLYQDFFWALTDPIILQLKPIKNQDLKNIFLIIIFQKIVKVY